MKSLKICLFVLMGMMMTTNSVSAQIPVLGDDPAFIRGELQSQQMANSTSQLIQAVLAQSFTFVAINLNSNFGAMPLPTTQYSFMRVQPSYLDVVLPYHSINEVPQGLNYLNFQSAEFTYAIDTTVEGILYVNISANDVMNYTTYNQSLPMSLNYRLHLEIFLSSGNALLTVMPDFYSSASYNGFVRVY